MELYYQLDKIQPHLFQLIIITKTKLKELFIPRSVPLALTIGCAITLVTLSSLTYKPSGYFSSSSLNEQ
jgi:hypothetical protein